MNRSLRLSMLFALGIMLAFTGCASKKNKQMNSMQTQISALTDEVVRLDQALQETRAAIQAGDNVSAGSRRSVSGSASVAQGIYRTPSGFELPSANIQKALKNAGYYQGGVDGKIGPATRDAVKSFQSDNGLEADGVVGRQTWNKLSSFLESGK
ncbi:MAG: peptidoglycan-binding protein [Candidatus Omnitrophica bacterium]|nr:peptidoglycan-binding protein [Candidatus Omnitrophota bacterium]